MKPLHKSLCHFRRKKRYNFALLFFCSWIFKFYDFTNEGEKLLGYFSSTHDWNFFSNFWKEIYFFFVIACIEYELPFLNKDKTRACVDFLTLYSRLATRNSSRYFGMRSRVDLVQRLGASYTSIEIIWLQKWKKTLSDFTKKFNKTWNLAFWLIIYNTGYLGFVFIFKLMP